MTAPTSFARIIGVAATAMAVAWAVPASLAFAHEGHQMECSDSSINTLKSDIQAMPEGKAKATAIKEMQAPVGRSKSPGYGHLKLPHSIIAVSAAEQR